MGLIWLYPLALCASVMAFSALMPRIAVQLSLAGHSGIAIGFFSMIAFLVVFLSTPFMPKLYRRLGLNGAYVLGLSFNLLSVIGLTTFKRYELLCLAAVLSGFAACCLWGATETLIARTAPVERLGSITGLYQSLLGGVLALGPFLPGLFGMGDYEVRLLAICALALASGLVGAAYALELRPNLGEAHHDDAMTWGKVLSDMPILLLAAFVGGIFEAGISNVGSAQSVGFGLSVERASFFAGVLAFGSLAMQWPIGMLADRFAYAVLLRLSLMLLALISAVAWLWPTSLTVWWLSALAWGGVGGALYTLAMISVGQNFRGNHTARYASASIAAYTLGCVAGPFLSGAAYDLNPLRGVMALLFGVASVGLLILAWLRAHDVAR